MNFFSEVSSSLPIPQSPDTPPLHSVQPSVLVLPFTSLSASAFSSDDAYYSYAPELPYVPPYATGFLMQPSPYGGFVQGLYTGPVAQQPDPSQWIEQEEVQDIGRPSSQLLSRELSKLSLKEKRKTKTKAKVIKQKRSPTLSAEQFSRWSVPILPDLGMDMSHHLEMGSASILVQV